VLKQYDCLDESIFNMKIHEANQMMNFRVHPNLINILSVWKTDATDSFTYKKIFMLYEDCQFGTFNDFILRDFKKFPRKRILKYFTDVAKGRLSSPRPQPPAQKRLRPRRHPHQEPAGQPQERRRAGRHQKVRAGVHAEDQAAVVAVLSREKHQRPLRLLGA
jgi:hypothetical protein